MSSIKIAFGGVVQVFINFLKKFKACKYRVTRNTPPCTSYDFHPPDHSGYLVYLSPCVDRVVQQGKICNLGQLCNNSSDDVSYIQVGVADDACPFPTRYQIRPASSSNFCSLRSDSQTTVFQGLHYGNVFPVYGGKLNSVPYPWYVNRHTSHTHVAKDGNREWECTMGVTEDGTGIVKMRWHITLICTYICRILLGQPRAERTDGENRT